MKNYIVSFTRNGILDRKVMTEFGLKNLDDQISVHKETGTNAKNLIYEKICEIPDPSKLKGSDRNSHDAILNEILNFKKDAFPQATKEKSK